MCGIVCALDVKEEKERMRSMVLKMANKIRHRGPDWSGIYASEKAVLAHERLAIVDPTSGRQPLSDTSGTLLLAANGEIYNHKELRSAYDNYAYQTGSDCEVILALYKAHGKDFLDKLSGIFGFVIYDESTNEFLIARDHMGIIPLYYGRDKMGTLYVASELKALEGICHEIQVFPPGHVWHSSSSEPQKWYARDWMNFESVESNHSSIDELRDALDNAVRKQLMSDVPYGVLLSGGLDSSIVSALAKIHSSRRIETDGHTEAWWPQLHSFSIGLEGSPDLEAAQKVADHIGTVHHEITFTVQEGLDAISDVIYHLETYDITTVRASTPMYLLARVIKSMGIKMVLSGEGADEIFGGYLYFHKAPDAKEFHEETVRKLDKLYQYDCLRANKSLAAWGVEGRVPFLDKEFMDVAMRLNPSDKMITDMKMEKWILRKAFEDLLPESVAWRQKEQFSDGVGYGWIDALKDLADEKISDTMMEAGKYRFPVQPPRTKEEYVYREIFEQHFPSNTAAMTVPSVPSVACSSETALKWDASFLKMNEPSGRAILQVHNEAYE